MSLPWVKSTSIVKGSGNVSIAARKAHTLPVKPAYSRRYISQLNQSLNNLVDVVDVGVGREEAGAFLIAFLEQACEQRHVLRLDNPSGVRVLAPHDRMDGLRMRGKQHWGRHQARCTTARGAGPAPRDPLPTVARLSCKKDQISNREMTIQCPRRADRKARASECGRYGAKTKRLRVWRSKNTHFSHKPTRQMTNQSCQRAGMKKHCGHGGNVDVVVDRVECCERRRLVLAIPVASFRIIFERRTSIVYRTSAPAATRRTITSCKPW